MTETSDDRKLLVEDDRPVRTLVLNAPPRNRMSMAFMDALEAEIPRIAAEPRIRAVVIRDAGTENFSVGMDLKELPAGVKVMATFGTADSREGMRAFLENRKLRFNQEIDG